MDILNLFEMWPSQIKKELKQYLQFLKINAVQFWETYI